MLKSGTKAPEFRLNCTPDQELRLEELKGSYVVLVFYPADWSPVCGDELSVFAAAKKLFEKHNAVIVGISVDSKWSHMEFSKSRNFGFPLLSDFEPKGAISKRYQAYDEEKGYSKRALYLIDKEGIIRWTHMSPDGINPGVDGVLDALDELTKK